MKTIAAAAALLIWSCIPTLAQDAGASLYAQRCAQCHDNGSAGVRAPSRSVLQSMPFDAVVRSITTGTMGLITQDWTDADRAAVASFVTGKTADAPSAADNAAGQCAQDHASLRLDGPRWNGWGVDLANSRFQPAEMAGITKATVSRLQLKWAFGFPGATVVNAQPTVVGGWLFVAGADLKVYALDAKSGCTRWAFPTEARVRTAISVAPITGTDQIAIYFGDVRANVYGVNAATGALIWKTRVEEHLAARITAAPVLYSGVAYVAVASIEEAIASRSTYQCCTFRGSVVALNAANGAQIWKTYTIPEAPHPTTRNAMGTQLHGPSGASIWSAPTIDVQRRALYVATGNSYSNPPADTSDAILALDLESGRELWHRQVTPADAYISACDSPSDYFNCPEKNGPDHDFGQSPILVTLRNGQRELVVGQKSGVVHALDPDQEGKILWQTRVGKGGALGGIMWGSAADQDRVYVANSDLWFLSDGTRRLDPAAGGGLFALDLADGKIMMQVSPVPCGERSQCSPALSAAVSLIPGVVFSGGVSGFLRAYATDDARLLWEIDTAHDYATVNGIPAHGGAIDGPGPVIVDGMLYVNSGYGQWSGLPGNALLAFDVR